MPLALYCSKSDKQAALFTNRVELILISSTSQKREQPLKRVRIDGDRSVAPKTAFV